MKPTAKPQPLYRLAYLAIAVSIGFAACNNDEQHRKDIADMKQYMRNKQDSIDMYLDRTWEDMDREYQERRIHLAADTAKMGEEIRTEYYELEREWETYKGEFERKQAEHEQVAAMDALRKTLVIDGVRPDYTDLKAPDARHAYEHFVTTVEANKDAYTSEQWQVINVNWKALNGRKREIEKDISAADKAEIAKLQLKYTGIKAVNRPFAESSS